MTSNAILAGIIILGVLELYTDEDALIAVIYAVGCGVALGQALFEPAMYELSAIFLPASRHTYVCLGHWHGWHPECLCQHTHSGKCQSYKLCITGTSGDSHTADQARYQEVGFCAAMIIVSLSNIAVYWYGIRKNLLYAKYIEEDDSLKPNKNPFAAGGVNTTASALESSTAMATGSDKNSLAWGTRNISLLSYIADNIPKHSRPDVSRVELHVFTTLVVQLRTLGVQSGTTVGVAAIGLLGVGALGTFLYRRRQSAKQDKDSAAQPGEAYLDPRIEQI
ncbi:hypothetical protein SARC_03644 [Sphaeroforma arctica JP610]|uniref:Uncharacterized protein n=1 Tax=Sphaeroforma arctica JP610 TaxID=667725 RepID=A0A0L0G7D9_9EUKA|nr:hypothetical protein SARC_03644 [Sphaeroforma arctica JP610]KNC84123.1 hypothetical protein SARC_03644 [Sphaeroforma arctica JP610]|eukprot:XP_014158025.1 hypothetical protein SARC_03644 [Sphaeroforma arctica JP610]